MQKMNTNLIKISLIKWPKETLGVMWSAYANNIRYDGRTMTEALNELVKDYEITNN